MKRKTYLLCALLIPSMAIILVSGYHARGHAAAQEAAPTDQGRQPAPTAVQAACAALEPFPLLPPREEAAVRAAAQQALDVYNAKRAGSIPLEILSIRGQDNWAVVECIRDLSGRPASGTESTLVLAHRSAGRWQAALPGDSRYASWLDQIPDRFLAPTTKEELRQLNLVAPDLIEPSIGIYRLPYPDGATVWITWDSDGHGGPIDMWSADGSVVAAMSGWVDGFEDDDYRCCCNTQCRPCANWLKLTHPGGEATRYFHLVQNSVTVTVGQWVEAGTVMAMQGDTGNSCGSDRLETGCGAPPGTTHCGIHVHFEVRSSAGDLVKPRICDGQGGWFYPEYDQAYVATDCPGNCCCSSRQGACGPGQPDWGFFAGAPAAQPTGIGDPLAASDDPVEPQRTPPASASYRVSRSVFGAGGGARTSASFALNGTLGQSTNLSRREGVGYVLVPGYWGRWFPVLKFDAYLPLVVRKQ